MSIIISPKIFATYTELPASEKISAETLRIVQQTEKIIGDTSRIVSTEGKFTAKVKADTYRRVFVKEKISGKIVRIINKSEKTSADTLRQITTFEKVTADLLRGLRDVARADTCRKISRKEKISASTVIRVPHVLNYVLQNKLQTLKAKLLAADNPLSLVNTFKDYGVTAINITLSERTLSDTFSFDIASREVGINEVVQGYLLDYPFNFLVEETSQTDLVQTVKGMYSVDELLYTQIFIPSTKIETENWSMEIVGGRYVKYSNNEFTYFYPTATEIMCTVSQALNLQLDLKIDEFTPYNLTADHRVTYADIISTIFNWTSRLPQRQINVFIRGGVLHCIQRGKEDSVFDISDLPYSRPTINRRLIRSLWSNPRADENADKDIGSNDDGNDPTLEYFYDENPKPFSGTISFSDNGCSTTLKYSNGLLIYEHNKVENSKVTSESSTNYSYEEIFPSEMSELNITLQKAFNKNFYGDFYLSTKKTYSTATTTEDGEAKKVEQSGETTYNYAKTDGDDMYLVNEQDETTITTYEWDSKTTNWVIADTDTDIRETFHVPIGNSWYGQSVYLNGVCQGSNISQGAPGNKVSQYMRAEVQKTFKGWTVTYENPVDGGSDPSDDSGESKSPEEIYNDWRNQLSPIADISFPVRELDLLKTLTNSLLWLNRKVEERVTVDLISRIADGVPEITHIVDFTERIRFYGAEFFLVSNTISFTSRKLIQKLQLIRWY